MQHNLACHYFLTNFVIDLHLSSEGLLSVQFGYAIMFGTVSTTFGIRYFAIYLLAVVVVSAQPTLLAWHANTSKRNVERGLVVAIQVASGNYRGIVASNIYLESQALTSHLGFGVGLALILLLGVAALSRLLYLCTKNNRGAKMRAESDNLTEELTAATRSNEFKPAIENVS